jgi:hypothetical protein
VASPACSDTTLDLFNPDPGLLAHWALDESPPGSLAVDSSGPLLLNVGGPISVAAWLRPGKIHTRGNVIAHGYRFGPDIDDVRIYGRALSSAEVEVLYRR